MCKSGNLFPTAGEVNVTATSRVAVTSWTWRGSDYDGTYEYDFGPGPDLDRDLEFDFHWSTQYWLNITADFGDTSPTGGWINAHQPEEFTAHPYSGYRLNTWTGDVVSTSNPLTLNVTEAMDINAQFIPLAPTNFLATYGWTPHESTLDHDGDGLPSLQEGIAGTLPNDPNSIPAITPNTRKIGPDQYRIEWASEPGRMYALQRSLELGLGFTNVVENLPATPPMNTHTDTVSNAELLLYRIGIELE